MEILMGASSGSVASIWMTGYQVPYRETGVATKCLGFTENLEPARVDTARD